MDSARALLDELMGKERNVPPELKSSKERSFDDEQVGRSTPRRDVFRQGCLKNLAGKTEITPFLLCYKVHSAVPVVPRLTPALYLLADRSASSRSAASVPTASSRTPGATSGLASLQIMGTIASRQSGMRLLKKIGLSK